MVARSRLRRRSRLGPLSSSVRDLTPNDRARARGYTAVEVLMAMTVMVIGAAAVISMQKATVQGDLDARKTDVANGIARTWIERLQRDAMQWTCPSTACPAINNITNARLLGTHVTGQWFLPIDYMGATPEAMSPGFDILGRDLPSSALAPSTTNGWAGAQFCVNVRLSWLVPQSLSNSEAGLIRADVRVLWPRGIVAGTPANGFCDATTAALADPETLVPSSQRPFFRSIYMTTSLTETPAAQ
jgi:prepilin-type N-terminal cleavage/methylation domain-containing protein